MLQAKDISYIVNDKTILSCVNLDTYTYNCIHLVGNNGVGKSTMLKILSGLLSASSGSISCQHLPLYIPSNINSHSLLTVKENLNFACYIQNISCSDTLIHDALNFSKLSMHKNSKLECLSSGQKQRIYLALLYLAKHKIWLLDEPANNLDQDGIGLLEKILNQHLSSGGYLIFASHIPLSISNKKEFHLNVNCF